MSRTVIGFFKDAADAQKALGQLESKGISRQHVNVSTGSYEDGTADVDGRNTNKFTDLFNKLFGHDSDDAKRYSTIGQSNVTLVTVNATSEDQAEAAADVLDDCGAIDVDEHGSKQEHTGSTGHTTGTSGLGNSAGNAASFGADSLTGHGTTGSGANTRRRSRIINSSLGDDFFGARGV